MATRACAISGQEVDKICKECAAGGVDVSKKCCEKAVKEMKGAKACDCVSCIGVNTMKFWRRYGE